MNTIIKINGLDVEFSEKVPTKPGVYWWVDSAGDSIPPYLHATFLGGAYVRAVSIDSAGRIPPRGLWSISPLVPAVEVERAYNEGFNDYDLDGSFALSRAKRVTEGRE